MTVLSAQLSDGFQFKFPIRLPESMEENSANLSCLCGKLKKLVTIPIHLNEAMKIFEQTMLSPLIYDTVLSDYADNFKSFLKKCFACKLQFLQCSKNAESFSGYYCYKNSAIFAHPNSTNNILKLSNLIRVRKSIQKSKNFNSDLESLSKSENGLDTPLLLMKAKQSEQRPVQVNIPMLGCYMGSHRAIRSPESSDDEEGACSFPSQMETSETECTIYPSKVVCIQRCAVGHTLQSGKTVKRTCDRKTHKWSPGNFEECRPFVDCGVTMVAGGFKSCSTPTVTEGVSCKINCYHYEQLLATRKRLFSCDAKGEWSPKLPFCAEAGSGLELVPAPGGHDM